MIRKLNLVLMVVTAGLTVAASSPRRSLELVMTPKHLMQEVRELKSRGDWAETRDRAEHGDAVAQFEIGMEMTRRWGKAQTGIEYDPDAALALFRKAARQEYLPARAALWKMIGGSPQELLYILPDEPTEDAAAALRAAQVNYIRPAFDACHTGLQEYGIALWELGVERQAMLHPEDAAFLRSDWAETKAMLGALFREHCETD